MKSILPIALVVLSSFAAASAQQPAKSPPNSAPIAWTEYRISSRRVAVSFPKLPVVRETTDYCAQTKGEVYHAYAAGAVYEFEWHANSGGSIPKRCTTGEKFSQATFTKRLDELKSANQAEVSDTTVAGIPASMIRSKNRDGVVRTRWLVWDKDRWFELAITRRFETAAEEERFVSGLKLSSSGGIKIGSGAEATLGDSDVDIEDSGSGTRREAVVVISKPRPGYTESAREKNVQGRVLLRVTFYRNGGIGGISVIKELPRGLTEAAIAAAKRIAFLPATSDGKPYNVTKQIEYTFSIY